MQSLARIVLCLSLLLAAQVVRAESLLVGDVGDPDHILFVGNETFTTNEIRGALGFNLDVLLAGHPEAPLTALISLVEDRVRDGYRHCGFADVQVSAQFVEQRSAVVVTISEGRRYNCGKIEVNGASTIPVDRLIKSIQARPEVAFPPTSKISSPLWIPGKHASFAAGHWQSQHEAFQRVFQSLGYFDVTFHLSTRPESDGTATLLVAIQDEGPQAILGEIEVHGAQKISPEEVIQFLDVRPGTILDSELKANIEKKLNAAARFLKHDVAIITPPLGNERSILRITLVEYADARPLSEPLSAEEQAMVRLAQWLNDLAATDDDLQIAFTDVPLTKEGQDGPQWLGTLRFVISPRSGASLLHASVRAGKDKIVFDAAVHVTSTSLSLDSMQHAIRYEATNLTQTVIGDLRWNATPPDDQGRVSKFHMGMGLKSNFDRQLPPFVLNIAVDPVAVVREAHREGVTLVDGVLTVEHEGSVLQIDGQTGRLLKFEGGDEETRVRVRAEPGLYQQSLAEYREKTANHRVISSGDIPISSLLSFVATCLPQAQSDTASASRAALIQSLLKRGAFHAFDRLLVGLMDGNKDEFSLPADGKKPQQFSYLTMALPITRALVPNPSWPWTASREFVFALTRRSRYTEQSIRAMLSDEETGPVANLTSAYLFGMLHPQLRLEFARRGLMRLKPEQFESDYAPFLQDDSPIGKLLLAISETLQEIDDQEIESIVQQLPLDERDRRALAQTLRTFPAHRTASPTEALRAGFDEAWEPLIAPRVRAVLEALAN